MTIALDQLHVLIQEIADLMEREEELEPMYYAHLLRDPHVAMKIIEVMHGLDDEACMHDTNMTYSACLFVLDLCVAQLKAASESGHTLADHALKQLMESMAHYMRTSTHTLNFWLPVLNAFYDVHIELSVELKNAYMALAHSDETLSMETEASYLTSIRELLLELNDLSVFEITEHFFAQSCAMPPEFFSDLVTDLYDMPEGQEVALLMLLHSDPKVRDILVATLDALMPHLLLSSQALSRLQAIKHWYPQEKQVFFQRWIKIQRQKGVVFQTPTEPSMMRLKASEVDGSGAQCIFIHVRKNRKNQLCGILFHHQQGLKDVWLTPPLPMREITPYYQEAVNSSVMLRDIDLSYLHTMLNHFLAITLKTDKMPPLQLLELQEIFGIQCIPTLIDAPSLLEHLSIQIHPFTSDRLALALKRSHTWAKKKQFTESWYVENVHIDNIVNHYCTFMDGVKVCQFEEALAAVCAEDMEPKREQWLFHFLWVALWLKSRARPRETIAEDCVLIAHALHNGTPLATIPLLREICYQSVVNSMETMQERRTHLHKAPM